MNNAKDKVKVGGDFITNGGDEYNAGSNLLTAGEIEVGGNFKQFDTGSASSFYTSGTHKVIFNGSGTQEIYFANYYSSGFTQLEIANKTGTIEFSTKLRNLSSLTQPGGSDIIGRDNVTLQGKAAFEYQGEWVNAVINKYVGNAENVIPTWVDCERYQKEVGAIASISTPTAIPTITPTSEPTAMPTITPTSKPTATPTITPTSTPTTTPTITPKPTATPTIKPTASPTNKPVVPPINTETPTVTPSLSPTASPSATPTTSPTATPSPTSEPMAVSTDEPTTEPTKEPVGELISVEPIGEYADKIDIKQTIADNKILLDITASDIELPMLKMYVAEYDQNGRLIRVLMGTNEVSEDKITIEADLPSEPRFKILLWDSDNSPLINAITEIK